MLDRITDARPWAVDLILRSVPKAGIGKLFFVDES
jgi:hypothetical protein